MTSVRDEPPGETGGRAPRPGSALAMGGGGGRRERRLRWLTLAPLLVALGVGVRVSGASQQTAPDNPALVIPSMYGRDLFEFYCAPCHGPDGKGRGPVAEALKVRPPDLTTIARRSGGRFPRARIEGFVTHGPDEEARAHGTAEMPVWGPTFRSLDPSDTRVKVRIGNLIDYIESIQAR